MSEIVDFVCPKCGSHYKLVRVRLEWSIPSRLLQQRTMHGRLLFTPF